jgi:hypothetical protein
LAELPRRRPVFHQAEPVDHEQGRGGEQEHRALAAVARAVGRAPAVLQDARDDQRGGKNQLDDLAGVAGLLPR